MDLSSALAGLAASTKDAKAKKKKVIDPSKKGSFKQGAPSILRAKAKASGMTAVEADDDEDDKPIQKSPKKGY